MIFMIVGCILIGFVIGSTCGICFSSYTINARWKMNSTEPNYLKYDGKLYKVIDQSIPKSWELARIRLKKKTNFGE